MAVYFPVFLMLYFSVFTLADGGDDETKAPGGETKGKDASQSIVLAHGVLMAVLFVIFFPLGAIILRISGSSNAAMIHGAWQVLSYIGALAAFGMGVYLATVEEKWITNEGHAIIGTIVIGLLFFQPIGGFIHHRMYKKQGKPTTIGSAHRWSGRILLVLGVINGGLGAWLAEEDKNFIIPYSVVAVVLYVSWAIIAARKKTTNSRKTSEASSLESL